MEEITHTGTVAPRPPVGGASHSSSVSSLTGTFADRNVSAYAKSSLEAVAQRSSRDGAGRSATTTGRRNLLSRFAAVVKSAFGMSRRTPDAGRAGPGQQVNSEPRVAPAHVRVAQDACSDGATDTVSRPLTPNEPPGRAVSDKENLAFGPVNQLGNYIASENERGNLPPALVDDLQTAVVYAAQLDRDIVRASDLLEQSQNQPLTDAERRELSSLLGASKHNVELLQTWLGDQEARLREIDSPGTATRTLMDALSLRFSDRHMDLADVMSLYEVEEVLDDPVSRADRAGAHLLHAEAALKAANELSVPGLDPSAKRQLVADLEEHRDLLAQIQSVSSGRIKAPSDKLQLASKQLWDAPVPLVKPKKGDSGDIDALRANWDLRAQGQSSEPWLPVAHPQVGQPRMLQEFMEYRLAQAGVPKNRMPDLKSAIGESYSKVLNDQPWDAISKRVRTTLPGAEGKSVVVESSIVPGKALAANFAEDYASNGINCADRTQYKHVPNLALTTLTNETGQTLFSGLRHGVIDAYDIDGKMLARLPEDELRTMVGDLLVREGAIESGSEGRDRTIDHLVTLIRSDPASAAESAEAMRAQASRDMAREMAAAALVANPEKFEKALSGETVDIDLSSISLLTPDSIRHIRGKSASDERTMLNHQTAAFAQLGQSGAVELQVRDNEGNPRTVTANVTVRQFNFGVNAGAVQGVRLGSATVVPARTPGFRHLMGWGFAMGDNDPNLRRLLGPQDSGRLEGDVAARVRSLMEQASSAREMARDQAAKAEQLKEQLSDDNMEGVQRAVAALTEEGDTLEKNARTLERAAHDVKTIWEQKSYRRGGGDPYKMVSRLALVSHLMGETPLFNCKSGKDRTGQLDAEVKFLATVADQQDGQIPSVDRSMEAWRSARNDFTLNTGNLEMQRLNTGLPGYKLAGVSGLKNMIADGMKPVYRGGSGYVAS